MKEKKGADLTTFGQEKKGADLTKKKVQIWLIAIFDYFSIFIQETIFGHYKIWTDKTKFQY